MIKNFVIDVFRPLINEIDLYENCVNAALYVCDKNIFVDFVSPLDAMDISSQLFPILL